MMKIYKKESQLFVKYLLQRKMQLIILKNYKSLKTKLHVHSLIQKNSLKEEEKEYKEEDNKTEKLLKNMLITRREITDKTRNKKLKLKVDQSNNLLFKLILNRLLRNSKKHYQIKVFSLELIIIIQ